MKATFNLNDYVYVQLNDFGRKIHRDKWSKVMAYFASSHEYAPPVEDADGWSKWQMHDLMNTFGAYMYAGFDAPMSTIIQIELADA